MSSPSTLEVFIFSKQRPEDIPAAIDLFRGSSPNGLRANITVMVPTERPDVDPDYSMVLDAFSKAAPQSYVIICKDTSVSSNTSDAILDALEKAIDSGQQPGNAWDIFYLAAWLDRCDQFSNIREINERGLKIVDTVSPNGVQCIMFSPQGRTKFMQAFDPATNPIKDLSLGKVLNSRISSRDAPGAIDTTRPAAMQRFFAATSTPHLVQFDVTKRKTEAELLKATECRSVPSAEPTKTKPSSNMGFFWFIIVVIVVILIAWALIKLAAGYGTTATVVPVVDTSAVAPTLPLTTLYA
ncbi:Hypothetical protein POVN_LOCUS731 [uncultured virus]|nr:Hypothetical protein POVN_LOCUS731 [uncultured virus]